MAYDLTGRLVIAVSARALFDLRTTEMILKPGAAFELVKKLLSINQVKGWEGRVEVILLSHAGTEASLRIFRALAYYHMNITRAVFLDGGAVTAYLKAFRTDLFLSASAEDVQLAVDMGIAAAKIETGCRKRTESRGEGQTIHTSGGRRQKKDSAIRIAFDGDAVLFHEESERIFQEQGLRAFEENETKKARLPLEEGPFAPFLKKLCALREELREAEGAGKTPGQSNGRRESVTADIRLALVTSRCAPAHERVIRTLNEWGVRMDELFFLGGIEKRDILQAFGADIFFDDQQIHTIPAAQVVTAALVPYRSKKDGLKHEVQQYSGRNLSGKTEPFYSLCGVKR